MVCIENNLPSNSRGVINVRSGNEIQICLSGRYGQRVKQTGKFAALACFGLILVTLLRSEGNLTENTVA
jgi:hypothetical protein